MKQRDYADAQRRRYKTINRDYDAKVRRKVLSTVFHQARLAAGLEAEDVAHRAEMPIKIVRRVEQALEVSPDELAAVAWPLRKELAPFGISVTYVEKTSKRELEWLPTRSTPEGTMIMNQAREIVTEARREHSATSQQETTSRIEKTDDSASSSAKKSMPK